MSDCQNSAKMCNKLIINWLIFLFSSIYIMNLVFDWIIKHGGVKTMYERSLKKSTAVYEVIDKSNGFYW